MTERQDVRPGRVPADRGNDIARQMVGLGDFGGRVALGLVGVVLGAVPFLGLLALVAVQWPPLHDLDLAVADGLNDRLADAPTVVRVLEILSELGGGATAGFVIAVAVGWLLIRRQPRLAAYLAATGIGLAVLVPVTKALVGRPRPEVALPVVEIPTNASFPSGHAMTSIVAWGALAVLALPVVRADRRRRLVAVTALLVVLVGCTRIALGVHFLTDVVAGWALGAAWLVVTALAFRHWLADRHERVSRAGLGEPPVHALHLRTTAEPALPGGRGTLLRLAGAALVIIAVLCAVGLLLTGPSAPPMIVDLDARLLRAALDQRSAGLTEAVHAVDQLGGLWGVVSATVAVAALSLAHRGSWRPTAVVLLAVIGEVLIYGAVSQIVGRARPDVRDLTTGLPSHASFPSGHVAAAGAVYGALCLIVLTYGRGRRRALVVLTVVVLVVALMAARVYVAAHHPTDTVAGALLALSWLLVLHRYLLAPPADPPTDADWRAGVRSAPTRDDVVRAQ